MDLELDGGWSVLGESCLWSCVPKKQADRLRYKVFANVDPSKGYKGITCFLVEKEMGVKIGKKEKKVPTSAERPRRSSV